MAVQFEGGVVVGADSRTTMGSYIVGPLYICKQLGADTILIERPTV